MSDEAMDQDKLAEEWAKALEEMDQGGEPEDPFEAATKAAAQDGEKDQSQDDMANEWAKALAMEEENQLRKEKQQKSFSGRAEEAKFKDLTSDAKAPKEKAKRDLDFILDIPLDVSAELGRTKLLINELLQLGQGSVVELNKLAGEPLEIYVNGKLVARGEAVVINEKFGVRLTDIISPIERVKQLA